MLDAQFRSGPTVIGWRKFERTRRRLTIRKIGNGQSLQCLRKKKTNGRHASKNASQLETMIATELAKSFSSGMGKSWGRPLVCASDFSAEPGREALGVWNSPRRSPSGWEAAWDLGLARARARACCCILPLMRLLVCSPRTGAYWLRLVVRSAGG